MTDGNPTGPRPDQFDDELALLDQLLAAEGIDADGARITRRPDGAPVPMSFAQELLWMLDRATPGLTAYNLPVARRLRGALDVAALEGALSLLVARHESLRSRFAEVDGEPRLLVDPPAPLSLRRLDLRELPGDEREAEASRLARDRGRTPFDLSGEHMFRATLLHLADDDHVLVLESHHIVLDGWSMGLLFRELTVAYTALRHGAEPTLPPVPIGFGDFATWQRAELSGDSLQRLLDFWREHLGDAVAEPLALPTDIGRAAAPSFRGARESVVLSPELTAEVRTLAQRHDATLYMVILAAYATVLHRYTGRQDVLVGSGSAGRTMQETESIVGYLNNTLVQRASFGGDPSFADLLGRVRDGALAAYDHQQVPLEKLVLELREGQDRLSPAPLFEVVLTMQDTIGGGLELDGLDIQPFAIDMAATKFDITLLVSEAADGLRLTAQYRADLFEPATMQRFLGHVQSVLATAAAEPTTRVSALPLLTAAERDELAAWNRTTAEPAPPVTLQALFEAQAARVPGRVAVVAPSAAASAAGSVAGAVTLTYAELDARANQLARHLRALGVDSQTPVGLLLDRSADAIVGLLGILKAGGAYVPLPVEAPPARLARQIAECGTKVVVTHAGLADRLPSGIGTVALDREAGTLGSLPDGPLDVVGSASQLAYVLFTSGSTGVPKGVAVTHANVAHYARALRAAVGMHSEEPADGRARQFGLASTLAADLGNTSLYPALLSGGTLHVLGREVTSDPERFAQYMAVHQLDLLKLTPNHLRALVGGRTGAELAAVLPREWLVTGGEALAPEFARTVLAADRCRLLNHYGPTETTVGALTQEVTAQVVADAERRGAHTVPLGRPLANVHAWVVDAYGAECPVGVPGELWLGGAGVAQGYYRRPELTAERFVDFRGERVYRTGDRVRRLPDGTLEFLGRADDQVKVRGYRVELAEVEHTLAQHPGVARCAVVLHVPGDDGDATLVAYAVAREAGYAVSHADRPTPEGLTAWVAAQLPEHMVPSAVVLLEALPLTANGKLDRAALPAPDAAIAVDSYVEPRTDTERQLAAIWGEVLKRERVGVTDNFLALGGHSLMAIRVLGKISRAFGVRLPLRTLFETPTVEALAVVVDRERGAGAPVAAGIGAVSRDAHRIRNTAPAGRSGPASEGASS